MNQNENAGAGVFPTTHWTSVLLAGRPEETAGWAALGRLAEKYRGPLLAHVRWKFKAEPERAEDWVQGFFERKILERHLLGQVRMGKGHSFRGFLCKALDNFVVDRLRAESCRKPPGGLVPLDEEADEVPGQETGSVDPGDLAWAKGVIMEAWRLLQQFYLDKQRADLWGVFDAGFYQPILNGEDPPSMSELARRFGFDSPDQASNGLITAKRKFKQFLRSVVAEYEDGESAIEAEIRELIDVLRNSE